MQGTEGQSDIPVPTVPWRGAGICFGPTRQKGRVKKREESIAKTRHQLQRRKTTQTQTFHQLADQIWTFEGPELIMCKNLNTEEKYFLCSCVPGKWRPGSVQPL